MKSLALVTPALDYLPGYINALSRGWQPNNLRPETGKEELLEIAADPLAFVASLTDREARGAPITMRNGTHVPRLPGYRLWLWDGEFCGHINLRWQRGTSELPSHVHGHIGYTVVPWKRQQGYATRALGMLLNQARRESLDYVDLTTDPDNVASQKVILANGGQAMGLHRQPVEHGGEQQLRFRIAL